MYFFLIPLILTTTLMADIPTQMYQLYQKGDYASSCNMGLQHFKKFESNEADVLLYAFSCLKADQIDRLNAPIAILNRSSEARSNASYFSMLVLQKKLLIQALYDHYPLKSLKLPTSSHLLSKCFSYYQKDPQTENSIKEYTDPLNPRASYKLYTTELNGIKTIVIDEYYDKILTLHHSY